MAHIELAGDRPSAIAGTWYPGSAPALRHDIDAYLANVPAPVRGDQVLGLIAPHAGYVYSGQVAAHAYRQVQSGTYDTVVIVSPIHRGYLPLADAALTTVAAYRTPLGRVPLNQEWVAWLDDRIHLSLLKSENEHSLEIQLPFLQVALGSFDILPLMIADQSLSFCRQLGDALGELMRESGRRSIIVASTDLSHFHPYQAARRLDRVALDRIEAYDVEGLASALDNGTTEACGGGPVLAALIAGQQLGADAARILNYANSGDVTGDEGRVVGYAAGVILRTSASV